MPRTTETTDGGPGGPMVVPVNQTTAAAKQVATVATPMQSHARMATKWRLLATTMAGTEAMRKAGEEFLPRHPYESEDAYSRRRKRAVFDNYVRRTHEALVGKAFRKVPKFKEDVPEPIVKMAEDMDLAGSAMHVVARNWFGKAVEKGFSLLLVDAVEPTPVPEGKTRTKADDEREGIRPFWRVVDAEDLLFATYEVVGGKLQFTEARIYEPTVVPDGWGEKLVERIRVLTPGAFELYERRKARGAGQKDRWVKVGDGAMGVDYIPLVPFYAVASKDGPFEATPCLEGLAHLNVKHFQSSSDQQNALTTARFPILAGSGVGHLDAQGSNLTIEVGPNKALLTSQPEGRFYFVEHSGAAISAGQDDLESLEEKMASFGAEYLRKKVGEVSATGRALDSSEAISQLQSWGLDFKDAIELALKYTADWLSLGEDEGGSVEYAIASDVEGGDAAQLSTLDAARARGDISRKAWVAEMKRRAVLGEDYDEAKDREEIDDEPPPPGGLPGLFGAKKPTETKLQPPRGDGPAVGETK